MDSSIQITAVRVYSRDWLVCELRRDGKPLMVRHGRVSHDGDPNWLDWLLDAPEADQREFVIAPSGESVDWRKLDRNLSAQRLISGFPKFEYKWKVRHLTTETDQSQLVECWCNLEAFRLVDLRSDGKCAQKAQGRGGASDLAGTFTWTYESSKRFCINHRLAQPIQMSTALEAMRDLAGNPSQIEIEYLSYAYDIMQFDGHVLELLETFDNGIAVEGPKPVWWRKWKRPKDW